ncbi:MBL fold metallo-hydrolase [Streptomyces olivaceus]|uniref:MBL fold metallo-hydrolase n=1 Tax=Streptomyces olivaceus TaxID=47716 RepID=UPI001CCF3706|nr:MBL fold metallo-hydrolase [Streptomyces olivaceus]MBZ6295940.1 MBL fold metallo-hydrolase [Streptomyces olivaceus]MBZ6330918.1 MBL fold metallo-hydrolase [Streptomyces olivaceus]
MPPSSATSTSEPVLQEVAEGVFAYVQAPGGWCVNNAGVLASGNRVALVDTAATEARARRLREHVFRDGRGAPFAVINTHSHGDHSFGNFVFPEATVYGHALARDEMDKAGLHLTELWPDVEWGDIELALPTVTYTDRMTLHVGEITAELIHTGPAHSSNDTVVWIPEQRVLFTGDIVMSGVTPFFPMGSITGSLRAVAHMRTLGAVTVVSGHGPVGGPEILETGEAYLRWVQELARAGIAAGVAPHEAARDTATGPFAELLEPERLVANLHRAYAEERGAALGQEPDVAAMLKEMGVIFQEMVDYNGGPITCHA